MKLSDFHFNLPKTLIAKYPADKRSDSRLLCLNRQSGAIKHYIFRDLPSLVQPNDLLVFNDSRVIPARLFGQKSTGGKVEILVERIVSTRCILAHIRASKSPKPGAILFLEGDAEVEVTARQDDLFELHFFGYETAMEVLERVGHIPLPPYIDRSDDEADRERYQTVYAQPKGSVAAPTAGLHFDKDVLNLLKAKDIDMAYVTLHVGAGTFQPVRVENFEKHKMHSEWITVSQAVCDKVKAAKARGGRVIAVGTTTVRSLETAARLGGLKPFEGDTDIFIYPGFEFQVVDGMITNFHLPESTLLMLVSAFCGHKNMKHAYQTAVEERYRFYSYGDAMLIV